MTVDAGLCIPKKLFSVKPLRTRNTNGEKSYRPDPAAFRIWKMLQDKHTRHVKGHPPLQRSWRRKRLDINISHAHMGIVADAKGKQSGAF